MVLWGSFVNFLAIATGAVLGVSVKLDENIRTTVMQGLGLAVLIIGINMGLAGENILIPIASLVLGGIIGESLQVEARLSSLGTKLGRLLRADKGSSDFSQGFLTASLVYCIGAMAVLGALDSGLQGSHDVLYAKAMLDGVSAVFFASSLGIGVAFSAIPVFLYQGSIALLANVLAPYLSPSVVAELTATGGLLIVGIGINILGLARIAIGNLLPGLITAVFLSLVFGG